MYAISRNCCTFSTVLAVRRRPFFLYDSRRNHCPFSPVLHNYVEDEGAALRRTFTALKPGGWLVFSVEHPVITSSDQAWQGRGRRQTWMVDQYFATGRRETIWLVSSNFTALSKTTFS